MSEFAPLPDADIRCHAKTLSDLERRMVLSFRPKLGWSYEKLAALLGADYGDVRSAGQRLRSANLAAVKPVRSSREYNGSALFLNDNGWRLHAHLSVPGL
jgi:hypothetical protein